MHLILSQISLMI